MNALFWLKEMATDTNAANGKHRLDRGEPQLALKVKTVPFTQHDSYACLASRVNDRCGFLNLGESFHSSKLAFAD